MTEENREHGVEQFKELADEFRHSVEIGPEYDDAEDAIKGHWAVHLEETGELDDSVVALINLLAIDGDVVLTNIEKVENDVVEEIADVLVTTFVLADMLGVDALEAYKRKMEYNMGKSSSKNDDNKVTDDREGEKPDMSDLFNYGDLE